MRKLLLIYLFFCCLATIAYGKEAGLTKTIRWGDPVEINGFIQPESICQLGHYLYVSNVNGGSGFISKVDLRTNKIENLHFLPAENKAINTNQGPLGIKIVGNTLYAVGFNQVLAFNVKTREKILELVIPDATRLNDVEYINGKLLVTETAAGAIYQIDIKNKTSELFKVDPKDNEKLSGINGLVWDVATNIIFATANSENNSPNSLLAIDMSTRKISLLYQNSAPNTMFFDGMFLLGRKVYFTDWKHKLLKYTLPPNGRSHPETAITELTLKGLNKDNKAMDGPPDIIISENGQYYIFPMFESGKVIIERRK